MPVLSALFRGLFLHKLRAAHRAGELQFFGKHTRLVDPRAFAAYLAPLWNTDWVGYCKRPFGGPKEVLRYLARYTHRVAISNRRLLPCGDNGVTFKWKDSAWHARGSNPHSRACGTAGRGYGPRFRALALFGRGPTERGVSSSLPAAEKQHKRRPEQVQQPAAATP